MRGKLLSLLLSLAMVISLATPMAAVDVDEWISPGYDFQQPIDDYIAANQAELSDFDADAYFEEEWGGWYTKEEYMVDFGLATQEEFYQDQLDSYVQDQLWILEYQTMWAELVAAEPQMTQRFLQDSSWVQEYYGYDSVEEMCQERYLFSCVEEGYITYYYDWVYEIGEKEAAIQAKNDFITQRGGVVGQLNVMVDGVYLDFADQGQPYQVDGVSYAPAQVLYDALEMDAPADCPQYVPIRSTAEGADFMVFYDGDYESVVLVNGEKIAAQLDEDFTIINRILKNNSRNLDENYVFTTDTKADITIFDSIYGDKVYPVEYSGKAIFSCEGMEYTMNYDMASMLDMVKNEFDLATLTGADTLTLAMMTPMIASMLKGEMEYHWDFQTGNLDCRWPELEQLSQLMGEEPLFEDGWMTIPMGDSAMVSQTLETEWSYGRLACMMVPLMDAVSPVHYYDSMTDTTVTAPLFGDDAFTREGGKDTLTIQSEVIWDLMMSFLEEDLYSDFGIQYLPGFTINLAVDDDGTLSGDYKVESNFGVLAKPAFLAEGTFQYEKESVTETMMLHIRNMMKVESTTEMTYKTTTETPEITR